jgi:subtilisin family serine protease
MRPGKFVAALSVAVAVMSFAPGAAADPDTPYIYYHDLGKAAARKHQPQWALGAIHARDAWKASRGHGVTVAVVDSGIGPTRELDGQIKSTVNLAGPTTKRIDLHDHGTAVSCVIAARHDRPGWKGITGVAPEVDLISVRIFGASGIAPTTRVAKGIRWAVNHGADIVNASFEDHDKPVLRSAVRYALKHGVIVVAGAGNEGGVGSPPQYPAAYPGVISVGAVRPNLKRASFSNEGDYVDVVAPGTHVLSCDPFATLSYYYGTSLATPVVTGVVALMKAARPGLRPPLAERILRRTARDLGAPGRDDSYGWGLVNAEAAVRDALRGR